MKSNWTIWLFVVGVVAIPLSVFAVVKWYEKEFQLLPVLGDKGHTIENFSFKSQDNLTITRKDWNNKIVVANFFFTHCISVCPKMMAQLKRVQAAGGTNLVISSFTVDPERDSVEWLKTYADRFGIQNNWLLMTGDKKALYRFARKDLLVVATDGDGGPNDFIHSENLVLIDPRNRIRGFYKGTSEADVDRLMNDIKKLQAEFGFK
jgi:protein SCO1